MIAKDPIQTPKNNAGTTLLKTKAISIEINGGNNETQPGRTLMLASAKVSSSSKSLAESDEASVNLKNSNSMSCSEPQSDGSIKLPSKSSL